MKEAVRTSALRLPRIGAVRHRVATVGALIVFPVMAGVTHQTPTGAHIRVQLLDLASGLYALYGAGGNALLLERDDDVLLVDVKDAEAGNALRQAAAAITDKPIRTAVFTHAHTDHIGGWQHLKDLTRILVHERAADALSAANPPVGAVGRSIERVRDQLTLSADGPQVRLYYFGPGHTGGDLVVVFPQSSLAHLGDLFPAKAVPFIDVEQGGSGVKLSDTLARAVAALKAQGIRRISTGHDAGSVPPKNLLGDLMTMADLEEYAAFNADFLEIVRKGFLAGKRPDEIAVGPVLAKRYKTYDLSNAPENVSIIHRELQTPSKH